MSQSSNRKEWMYTGDYADALNSYVDRLGTDEAIDLLKDFIWEYMETSMTNEQVQQFIDTGEW